MKQYTTFRSYLSLPLEELPDDWRLFVAEYRRQKADAEAMVVSDDKDKQRRGRALLKALEGMR